jgi:hypothetical protein
MKTSNPSNSHSFKNAACEFNFLFTCGAEVWNRGLLRNAEVCQAIRAFSADSTDDMDPRQ